MPRLTRRSLVAAIAPFALAAAIPATAPAATAFYGVTSDNRLAEFQSDNANQAPAKAIRGLAAGENIVGLDLRPADGRLYAVTNQSRIVIINPRNGQITRVGDKAFAPALTGDRAGFDFNPVRDRIRVETNAAQNLRIDPDTGQLETIKETVPDTPAPTTPAPTTPDTPGATTPTKVVEKPGVADKNLAYPAGDPGAGTVPRVNASAYTNSFPKGATTDLFVLDQARNALAKQDPENDGTLRTVGALGTTGQPIAFDIVEGNAAYAAVAQPGSKVGLYRVNLQTGKAARGVSRHLVGTKQPLVALAAAGEIANDNSAPGLSVSSSSTQMASRLLGGLQLTVNCDEACSGKASVKYKNRTVGTADVEVSGKAGFKRVTVPMNATARNAIRGGSIRIELRVEVADGAGNKSSLARPIRSR